MQIRNPLTNLTRERTPVSRWSPKWFQKGQVDGSARHWAKKHGLSVLGCVTGFPESIASQGPLSTVPDHVQRFLSSFHRALANQERLGRRASMLSLDGIVYPHNASSDAHAKKPRRRGHAARESFAWFSADRIDCSGIVASV